MFLRTKWLLGGFVLTAATFGTATITSGSANEIPLPESHSWDFGFLLVAAFLQFIRILWPLVMLGASVFVALAHLLHREDRATALVLVFPVAFFIKKAYYLIRQRSELRKSLRSAGFGNGYVGLFTHWYRLRQILHVAPVETTWRRFEIIAALLSWQEGLCCVALGVWALLAFTPDLLTPGAGWPLKDVTSWLLMQMDWAWQEKWQILLQSLIVGVFIIDCVTALVSWKQRRKDLLSVSSVRRGHAAQVFEHLLTMPEDSCEEKKSKASRLGQILAKACAPPSFQENLSLPLPTMTECVENMGFMYGVVFGVLRMRVMQPQLHPLLFLLLLPITMPLRTYMAMTDGDPIGWVAVAVALFLTWGLAELITRVKRIEWVATFARELLATRDECMATVNTRAKLGPFPYTLYRLLGWAAFLACVASTCSYGYIVASWIAHANYLPAYTLPAYSSFHGGYYCRADKCMRANEWVKLGGGWRSTGCAHGTGCSANASGDFWAGWWEELRVAARVNVLAARAWREGGLNGVQLAMEALLAASSPDALASPEVRKRAILALQNLQRKGLAAMEWRMGQFMLLSGAYVMDTTDPKMYPNWSEPAAPAAGVGSAPTDRTRSGAKSEAERDVSGPEQSAARAAARERERAAASATRDSGRAVGSARTKGSEPVAGSARSIGSDSEHEARGSRCRGNEYKEVDYETDEVDGHNDEYVDDDSDPYSSRFVYDGDSCHDYCAGLLDDEPPVTEEQEPRGRHSSSSPSSPRRDVRRRTAASSRGSEKQPKSYTPAGDSDGGSNAVGLLGLMDVTALVYLALPAIAAAYLVVMQPEWVQSPGRFVRAVKGLLPRRRRAYVKKPVAEHASGRTRPGAKKSKQQQPNPGTRKQTPAAAPSKDASIAEGLPDGTNAATDAAPKQDKQQAQLGDTVDCAAAPMPITPGAASMSRRKGRSGGGTAARPAVTPAASSTSSAAAVVPAALPFTASLARQTSTQEPAPTIAATSYISIGSTTASTTPAAPVAASSARTSDAAPTAAATTAAAAPCRPAAMPVSQTPVTAAAAVPVTSPTTRPQPRLFGQAPWSSVVSRKPTAASPAANPTSSGSAVAGVPVPIPVPVPVPVPIPVPVPVPVPAPGALVSPRSPTQPAAPPSTGGPPGGSLVGLNPALARGLAIRGRLAPAAGDNLRSQAGNVAAAVVPTVAAATTSTTATSSGPTGEMPLPRGGIWGNAPGLHPDYCGVCQAQLREVCVMHGLTVHISLCTGCAADFALGGPCPVCGEPVQQLLNIDVSKLKRG